MVPYNQYSLFNDFHYLEFPFLLIYELFFMAFNIIWFFNGRVDQTTVERKYLYIFSMPVLLILLKTKIFETKIVTVNVDQQMPCSSLRPNILSTIFKMLSKKVIIFVFWLAYLNDVTQCVKYFTNVT